MTALVGDIGGTNARLAIAVRDGATFRLTADARYRSDAFPGIVPIARRFLDETGARPRRACLAVAGPVREGRSRPTNLPWVLDAREIGAAIGIERTVLINDFDAVGHGLALLGPTDVVTVRAGTPEPGAPVAVIGPGTGLGHGFVTYDADGRAHVHASEGGHATFAPWDETTSRLASALRRRYGHCSWERVVSGPGLVNLYRHFAAEGMPERPETREAMSREDAAAVVTRLGLAGEDAICAVAVDVFAMALAAQAGNLALTVRATGGVYIAGGIAPRMIERLGAPDFGRAFASKGRLSDLLAGVPVHVVTEPNVGLFGAAAVAEHL